MTIFHDRGIGPCPLLPARLTAALGGFFMGQNYRKATNSAFAVDIMTKLPASGQSAPAAKSQRL